MSAMLVLQSEASFIADDKAEVFPDLCRDLSIYLSCISSGGLSFPTRERLCSMSGYQLSWVEVLLFTAAIVAMAEQVKVAKPGINNTTDVLLIGATAIIQILLFALAAAKVPILGIFNSTEFLLRTLIKLAQTAVAYQINAATLMRTISS